VGFMAGRIGKFRKSYDYVNGGTPLELSFKLGLFADLRHSARHSFRPSLC